MANRCVITVGHFDGVHVGHQAILRHARKLADKHHAHVRVMCFDPHPYATLKPKFLPTRLTSCEEKIMQLKEAGADEVEMIVPTQSLLDMTPRQFLDRLVHQKHPVAMVEGEDFHFGKNRAGHIEDLKIEGQKMGFEVDIIKPIQTVLADQLIVEVHSSLIRELLKVGRVYDAARCLGRPFSLVGKVVQGEQRGRKIGVPTANLADVCFDGFALPADGVYAASVGLYQRDYVAAVSIGTKPTFGENKRTVEVHLLDFEGDLYGQTIQVAWLRWLRGQAVFSSVEMLKKQLDRDINQVKQWHQMDLLTYRLANAAS